MGKLYEDFNDLANWLNETYVSDEEKCDINIDELAELDSLDHPLGSPDYNDDEEDIPYLDYEENPRELNLD